MIVGENYYQWTPNHIKYKGPDSGRYSGTVIGNTPLEEHLIEIDQEGEKQKQRILEHSAPLISEISELSQPFVSLWSVVAEVENAMTTYPWQG